MRVGKLGIRERHPAIVDQLCVALQRGDGLHITAAVQCREQLIAGGFDCPEWRDVARGLRPGQFSVDDPMPGARKGWQRGVAAHVDEAFRTGVVWPRLYPHAGAPPFPKWPGGRRAIQLHPIVQCDSVRTKGVPCVVSQTLLVPCTLIRVKLPVWPSTRSKWPPTRSLSARRSVWAKGASHWKPPQYGGGGE